MRRSSTIIMPLLLCLTGCGGLLVSDQPAEQTFWLESPTLDGIVATADLEQSIRVRLDARPGLDTDRILVRRAGGRFNHYEGAKWPDHSAEVVESLLRLTLESTGAYQRVMGNRDSGTAARHVHAELRRFFAVYQADSSPPVIEVEIAGYLDCDGASVPIASEAKIPASRDTLVEVVRAFQQATDQVLTEIASQAITKCARTAQDHADDSA
jgi:ABC-type uncharacterized transport system auxiliary subunit